MRDKINQLRADRNALVVKLRGVLNKAGERALNTEERSEVTRIEADIDAIESRLTDLERSVKHGKVKREDTDHDGEDEGDEEDRDDEEDEEDRDDEESDEEDRDDEEEEERNRRAPGRNQRAVKIGKNGKRTVTLPTNGTRGKPQRRDANAGVVVPARREGESDAEYTQRSRRCSKKYIAASVRYILGITERRDLQSDVDFSGGYLVMPQTFVNTLIKAVDNLLWIRQLATKYQVAGSQSLGFPTLDTDAADSDWTSELQTGNEDTSFAFGKRELIPKPIAKRLKVSNKLLRQASINGTMSAYDAESGTGPVENFLIARLRYKLAVPQEKGFLTGNGINQPLGIFTASTRGISTGRDVSTGSTTGITGDGLVAAKYSLKQQYHTAAKWLFSREAVKRIRQLKDSYGQYLWQPGLQLGAPDVLLNLPIMMSEYAPTTFTDGNYIGMLADFSYYVIADAVDVQIQRLEELYAENNQTGYIVRAEVDGMPVLEEAFARLKCAA